VVEWWRHHTPHSTDDFIEVLRAQRLGSNVDLGEVQNVRLEDLVGVDDAVQTLLRTIVLPHEDEALAEELGLRAKRGVLLYGPPGTGKTTVGRALAHRMRGKFFLIDGTFIAGTDDFYNKVQQVFEAAKENSPSVIFVDDADAIFENRSERGLYRYLLTMIDGLESESSSQVTVILTAMNLGDLPEALVRSGRVELWLEMRLPDADARRILLARECAAFPEPLRGPIPERVIEATDGLTGADLKGCAADAKSLYAAGRKAGQPAKDLGSYLLEAAATIRVYRKKHQEALTQSRQRQAQNSVLQNLGMFTPPTPRDDDE
jgi:SpoVK/Ycf46/Vps4 family AAA+-type ATPase